MAAAAINCHSCVQISFWQVIILDRLVSQVEILPTAWHHKIIALVIWLLALNFFLGFEVSQKKTSADMHNNAEGFLN